MRKIYFVPGLVLVISTVFLFSVTASAAEWQVSAFGGVNHVFAYGSDEDYVMGGNDFPVTPVHTPASFGTGVAFLLNKNIGFELSGFYVLPSTVTLQDPSDQDTVEIETSPHISLTINLIYQVLAGRFRPYVVIGGGGDMIIPKEATYISEYGYEITLIAPPAGERIDMQAHVGLGFNVFFTERFGLRLDARYVMIFDNPNRIDTLSSILGLFVRF